ncbi:MAG: tRNA lysidine(34) synthetase [Bacillota bacterium]
MSRSLERILRKLMKAIQDYKMIDDPAPIMVGLSGGKDSLTLLYVLNEFRRRSKHKYPLAAGHVSMGWDVDYSPLEKFCRSLNIPFYLEPTSIGPIVFDVRQEKNPCSLCAKMRRGALNNLAKKNGFSKVALAHHIDDAVETLLLKTFFEGRIESFAPVTYLDIKDVTVIRPFIYVPEKDISLLAKSLDLPIVFNPCPANGATKRQDMKEIVKLIERDNPYAKDRAISALRNLNQSKWTVKK